MKVVRKIVKLNIFLIILISIFSINVYAEEFKPKMCTLNKDYIKWEKLSKKKKSEVIMPPMCDPTADNLPVNQMRLLQDEEELPETYDIRTKNYVASVKNQQDTGSCWAFSTTTALEVLLKKQKNLDYVFSPRHMVYSSIRPFLDGKINFLGYNNTPDNGGNFFMSSNYLINNYGPVLEEDMPFENNEDLIDINSIYGKKLQTDTNNVVLNYTSDTKCSSSEITNIKKYIYEYGAVTISTYINSNYYQSTTAGYYYNGTSAPNHAVTIVGWDDTYSKDNFVTSPSHDGAWIVQNSYGTSFGEKGYYYISYEDVNGCYFYMTIRETDQEIEDNSYIYDNLGFNTFIGYTQDGEGYTAGSAMNVFDKKTTKTEVLKEISFASSGAGIYNIYYMEGNASTKTINDMQLIGTGTTDMRGYYTHKLEEELLIGTDVTQFSIVVSYEMLTSTTPLPLSSSNSTFYTLITLGSNKSFISPDGNTWQDLSTLNNYTLIASIKAYTDNYIETQKYNIDEENKLIYVELNTSIEKFTENVTLKSLENLNITSKNGKMYTGQIVGPYTVIVKGDVTGDGSAKMNDVMMISKYIVDGTGLEEDYLILAADVIKDSSIKMNDVMRISNYIVEGGTL